MQHAKQFNFLLTTNFNTVLLCSKYENHYNKKYCLAMNIINSTIPSPQYHNMHATCISTELLKKKMLVNSVRNKCLTQIMKFVLISVLTNNY